MRHITMFEALFPIIFLITSLSIAIGMFHTNINFSLALSLLVLIGVAIRLGASLKELMVMAFHGVKPTLSILLMFLLIGVLIGIWHLCGTIPAMIYYGLTVIHKTTFYLSVFIVTSIVSMLLGTSLGTVSTVGVAMLGIAHSLGLPVEIAAGAVISGAFLGDRSSPLSTSANLTAVITGTELYKNLQYMITTIALPFIISSIIFFLLGQSVNSSISINQLTIVRELAGNFKLNWITLLPPFLVLILSLCRVSIKNVLIAGTLSGIVVAIVLQNSSWLDIVRAALLGYAGPAGMGELRQVIKGGGVVSFINMELVIILAASLTGIFEGIGAFTVLLDRIIGSIRSARVLTLFSMLASILTAIITANQTLAIIIPARLLVSTYKRFEVAPNHLARALADSGVMVVPLVPWNVAGLFCAGVLGVSTLQYLPYTVLCWLTPLAAVLISLIPNKAYKNIDQT